MRLVQMGQYFIEGRSRKGCGMLITREGDNTYLDFEGRKLATISDRTDEGYTLTIHPVGRDYGLISYCNRISALFRAINGDKWDNRRYSAYQRYTMRIWDYNLHLEIQVLKDLKFIVRDNVVKLDYNDLEQACLGVEVKPEVKINPLTNGTKVAIDNLMADVANI